jgi:hypothetical protein
VDPAADSQSSGGITDAGKLDKDFGNGGFAEL